VKIKLVHVKRILNGSTHLALLVEYIANEIIKSATWRSLYEQWITY